MSDAASGDRSRTILLAGLGVVALGALVAFVLLPLLTGSDAPPEDETDVVVVDQDQPEPTPTPSEDFELADPDEVEGELPAETFEVFNARDPFQQLVEDETGGGTDGSTGGNTGGLPPTDPGTTPGTPPGTNNPGTTPQPGASPGTGTGSNPPPDTSGDGSNGSGTDGSNGSGTDGSGSGSDGSDGSGSDGSGSDGSGSNGSDAQVGGTQVTLVDVFNDDDGERQATVTVNGTGYTVGEGDTFGRRFRLLDISGRCATMLFGDSRFTLCEGERIRK